MDLWRIRHIIPNLLIYSRLTFIINHHLFEFIQNILRLIYCLIIRKTFGLILLFKPLVSHIIFQLPVQMAVLGAATCAATATSATLATFM